MDRNILKKSFVIGIIILFVLASFILNVSSDTLGIENIDYNKRVC